MIVQTNHYNPDGSARPIPFKDANGNFVLATIIPALDGKSLELDKGASLRGDSAVDADHRKYVPDDLGGAKIVAICEWEPQDGTTPGGILRYSDGRRRPVRFS